MTTPDIFHHFEFELTVPATADQVWRAIASADGISAWMMPAEVEPRVGGAVSFHMGPDVQSNGHVTAFEPAQRFAYEEDWATLCGHAGAAVTPLATEFLVEARSGGTCVVRIVTSAYGEGADWEHEFWDEMVTGWAPLLDNLRLYLTNYPDQQVTSMWVGTGFAMTPELAIAAVRRALGIEGHAVGDAFTGARDTRGRVERELDRQVLVRLEAPVPGLLSWYSYDDGAASEATGDARSIVHLQAHLFSDQAAEYADRERPAWQAWLEAVAAGAPIDAS